MYAISAGAAQPNFVREHTGYTHNVAGPRKNKGIDSSRQALHDQTSGSLESCQLIYFEHDWPSHPFPQEHAHEHKVGVSFIKDSFGLPPQHGQQPKWEKQIVEKLEYFKNKLRTLTAHVFPNALNASGTIFLPKKWHQSSGFERINAWRR
jgi:hypothetical protein